MGRPDVMGTYEIGQRLGVGKSRVHQIVREKGFPDPTVLHMGSVWSRADVEAWIRRHRPELAAKR